MVRQPVFTPVITADPQSLTRQPEPSPAPEPPQSFRLRVGDIKRIDPAVGLKLSRFPWHAFGVERSQLTVPVAPTGNITLDTVFEDPKNPTATHCWPRYGIDVAGATHYRVRFRKESGGSRLVVHLRQQRLPVAGRTALEHRLSVLLRYNELVNGTPSAMAEVALPELTLDGDVICAEILVTQLALRDAIYRALTEPALNATLIVRMSARVAVPIPANPAAAQQPLYRESERVVDQPLNFLFNPTLHPYIFEGLGAISPGGGGGLLRRQAMWKGRFHSYYQAGAGSNVFYYLPDTFKLGRRPAAPHEPFASVRFDSDDGSLENMQASFAFFAAPVIDQERLLNVIPTLRASVDGDVLRTEGDVQLEPLLPAPDNLKLKLSYPGAGVSGGPFQARPAAAVCLRSGVTDTLTMPLPQFQALYDSLFSAGGVTVTGIVSFQMGDVGEEVPFTLRLSDTAEPHVGWIQQGTALHVTNEIESPLLLDGVRAFVNDAGAHKIVMVPAPASPLRLDVAASATFPVGTGQVIDIDLVNARAEVDRDLLFHLILDPTTSSVYLRPLTVKTFPAIFKPPPANPDDQIIAIVLDFEGGVSIELNENQLERQIRLPVPLASFVLRRATAAQYRYKMNIVRLSGQTRDAGWRVDDTGTLFPNVR
jgi:hypothetical protein